MTATPSPQQSRPHRGGQRYERHVSAGGVVYREQDGLMQILLCGRRQPPLWCLPKGTPDNGETVRQTAIREVEEETGVKPRIIQKIGAIRYFFKRIQDNTLCDKTVHHFLMVPEGGDTANHDHEFDEVHWFPVEEAMRLMSYPNEVTIVRKAIHAASGSRGSLPDALEGNRGA